MTFSTCRIRRRAALWAAAVIVVTVGAGCSGPSPLTSSSSSADGGAASSQSATNSSAAPAPAPGSAEASVEASEKTSALEAARSAVDESLRKLARSAPKPNRNQMRAAYREAGLPSSKTEVSADITPTGLPVDSIQAAAPVGRTCVVGEVRDGKVTVVGLPVLASGRCFVGDDR